MNIKIPWGAFDSKTGKWHYSKLLASISKFSEAKQRESNIQDGYMCKCGYMPSRCRCGKEDDRAKDRYSFVRAAGSPYLLLALDGEILPGQTALKIDYDGKGRYKNSVQVWIETFADYNGTGRDEATEIQSMG